MYAFLLAAHSVVRWLVLVSLLFTIVLNLLGWLGRRPRSGLDDAALGAATGIGHTQMLIGLALYFVSPFVKFFWGDPGGSAGNVQLLFFGAIHIVFMLTAVVLMTVGTSKARKEMEERKRFATILLWYSIALTIILCAIPWPFSPLAARPFLRPF